MKTVRTLLGAVVVLFLFSVVFRGAAFAVAPTLAPPVAATSSPAPVEYVLPYPGLLPTHPLYILKSLRDRVMEMLISDTLTKADFYIHQADKKLGMGIALMSAGKRTEANTAFADALSVRTQAVGELEKHIKSGGKVPGHITEKLMRSLTKHQEVLLQFDLKTDGLNGLYQKAQQMLSGE